jgi:hypothetical protein
VPDLQDDETTRRVQREPCACWWDPVNLQDMSEDPLKIIQTQNNTHPIYNKQKEQKEQNMPTQYQCSRCSGAVCTDAKSSPLCSRCHTSAALTCHRCLVSCVLPVTTCLGCTSRKHICLSPASVAVFCFRTISTGNMNHHNITIHFIDIIWDLPERCSGIRRHYNCLVVI